MSVAGIIEAVNIKTKGTRIKTAITTRDIDAKVANLPGVVLFFHEKPSLSCLCVNVE